MEWKISRVGFRHLIDGCDIVRNRVALEFSWCCRVPGHCISCFVFDPGYVHHSEPVAGCLFFQVA